MPNLDIQSIAVLDNLGNGVGVIDTLNVTDDFEIADVNVRVNILTHTYDGDVTFGIRGPNGYGTNLITLTGWAAGGVFQNFGSPGDNFTNTVIDDEAVNDIITAANVTAPYTNSYFPAFNSPSWNSVLLNATQDAVPQLSRFDGTSTLGNWNVVASDHTGMDIGTLQSWSLIVTPRAFTCSIVTAANATISGRVVRADGTGVSRVRLKITNSAGETRSLISGSFGYFVFEDVSTGETYTIEAIHKRYNFAPQVINVNNNIEDLNFVAQP